MVYNTFAELAQELGLDPNNPTYEGQQKLRDWLNINQKSPENPEGYEVRENTQKYLDAPTTPPPQEMPQDSVFDKGNPANLTAAPWNRQEGGGTDSLNQVDQTIEEVKAQEEADKAAKRQQALDWWAQQGRNVQTAAEGVGEGLNSVQQYVPMSAALAAQNQLTSGVDRSGESAGYEALAAQNQYNAAQNEKLRQANMQQAMDNTIADKMAAAEAESKWKQNARALREGGAQAVASQNEAATPDLWKQKQLQNERRDVAAQNLAEVDKNRRQAVQNETKASMTNYNTRVNDNLNMRANTLSLGKGAEDNSKNTEDKTDTSDTKTEGTDTTETKTEDTKTQPSGTTSTAPSNQESEGTEAATDKVAIDNIIAQVNELNNKLKNKQYSTTMLTEYNNLKEQYNALKDKVDNPPAFPEMWKPSDDSTDVSNIASTIDDLTM
jgi:hypothetical protein